MQKTNKALKRRWASWKKPEGSWAHVIAQYDGHTGNKQPKRLQATTTTMNRVTIRGQDVSSHSLKGSWHSCASALCDTELKSFLFHEELCAPSSSLDLNQRSRQQQVSALQAFCLLSRFPFIPERTDSEERREAVTLKSNLNLLNEAKGSLQRRAYACRRAQTHSDSSSDSGSHIVQCFTLYFLPFMIDGSFLLSQKSFCSIHRRHLTWSAF